MNKLVFGKQDKSIPEIFRCDYNENFLTLWLAYILETHPKLLNLFLSGEEEESVFSDKSEFNVIVNKRLKNNQKKDGFIDLFIKKEDVIIAIENKVDAGLSGEDQLQKYNEGICEYIENARNCGKEYKVEKILLLPKYNSTKASYGFRIITYTDLLKSIKTNYTNIYQGENISTLADLHLYSFADHIENKLDIDTPFVNSIRKLFSEEKTINVEAIDFPRNNELAVLSLNYIIVKIEKQVKGFSGKGMVATRLNSPRQDYVLFYDSSWTVNNPKYRYSEIHYEIKFDSTTKNKPLSQNAVLKIDFEINSLSRDKSIKYADFFLDELKKQKATNFNDTSHQDDNLVKPRKHDNNNNQIILSVKLGIDYSSYDKFIDSLDKIIDTAINTSNKYNAVLNEVYKCYVKDLERANDLIL